MSVKLTITIVAYNNYVDIKNAIKSINDNTSTKLNMKIYIVDNGSNISNIKDKKVFLKFISKYKNIEYIDTKENLGFGSGHNFIINKLDSEYHAIVNPDILIKDDVFSKIIEFMELRKDIGMSIPNIIDIYGRRLDVYRKELTLIDMFIRRFSKRIFSKRIANHTMQYMDYTKPFEVPFGQGSFLVIRTELFKRLKGFDEGFFMYLEDADLCKRVNQISKLMYFPGATVIHKWEQGSHKNLKLFKYHIKSTIYYFSKWGYRLI